MTFAPLAALRPNLARCVVVALALTSGLALAGCPSGPAVREDLGLQPDPIAALAAYRDALAAGRVEEAFAFIHPSAREGLDLAGFAALYARHKDALVTQADALLARARASKPIERARVRTSRGEFELERTPEGWRLLTPVAPSAEAPADPAAGAPPRP